MTNVDKRKPINKSSKKRPVKRMSERTRRKRKKIRTMAVSWLILIAFLSTSLYGSVIAVKAISGAIGNAFLTKEKTVLHGQVTPEETIAPRIREDKEILDDLIRVSKEYNFDKSKASELDILLMEAGYKVSLDKQSNLLYVDAWTTKKEILDGQKTVYVPLIELKGKSDYFPVFKIDKIENDQIYDETEINDHFKLYPNFESWFTTKKVTAGSFGFEKAVKNEADNKDESEKEIPSEKITDETVVAP